MGAIEAVKKGFKLGGKNWNLVLVLFLLNLLSSVIGIPLKSLKESSISAAGVLLAGGSILLLLVLGIFIQAGILGCIIDVVKQEKVRLTNLLASGRKFFWRLLGLGALVGLIVGFLLIFSQVILVLSKQAGGNVFLTSLGFFISILLGILAIGAGLLLFYSPYILIAEECGIVESARRSVKFVKGFLASALGTLVLIVLIIIGASIVLAMLLIPLAEAQRQIVGSLLVSGLNAYLGIVGMIAFMSLYMASAAKAKKE